MKRGSRMCEITAVRMFAALALLVSASTSALAGPPFQTDDPEPIEFRNYEFYMFATSDGTPVETDIFGPALEFRRVLFVPFVPSILARVQRPSTASRGRGPDFLLPVTILHRFLLPRLNLLCRG